MANIAQPVRIHRAEIRDEQTNAQQQSVQGTNANAPIIPLQRKSNSDGQGNGSGQSTDSQQQAFGRAAAYPGPQVTKPWLAQDSVLHNIGPFGVSTYADGSIQRQDWSPGGKFTATQGKELRVAGSMPAPWGQQINEQVLSVAVQTKPMNRDFIANGRYNVPIRV